jgi:hypothetical protein
VTRAKVGRPRGQSCRWTPELDEVLKAAWRRGGLRAAGRAISQLRPEWSIYSIKRRAAALSLCRPRARAWTEEEVNQLLSSVTIALLPSIAKRLGRSVRAIRHKLWSLGYTVESLGGYKVKELAGILSVPPGRVRYWVAKKLLLTKGGRITDSSFSKFLADHPRKIPFETLRPEIQDWLLAMGFPEGRESETAAGE